MRITIDNNGDKTEIDIEPNDGCEEPHLYVTITTSSGEHYEGRLYEQGKGGD